MNTVKNALNITRLTDTGKLRERNEDSVASDTEFGLALLADGMGGYNAGDVASQMAALTITAELISRFNQAEADQVQLTSEHVSNFILEAVDITNNAIYQVAQDQSQCEGMGTTLVTTVFVDNQVVIGHIGDSRAYLMRGNLLSQITTDHSVVQEHINSGLIGKEEAKTATYKNYLTKALGVSSSAELEINTFNVLPRDIYLLCSDGLTDMISDDDIEAILLENNTLELAANALIQKANLVGGKDNISVILIEVLDTFTTKKPRWFKSILDKVGK